jgi:hypothetical protein
MGNGMGQPSLAERLGYRPDDRLLIVNCDDLGSSHSANVATFGADIPFGRVVRFPSGRRLPELN